MAKDAEKPRESNPKPAGDNKPEPRKTDEDPVGKVYDSRLIKRLGHYLRPYWWQAAVSSIAISLKSMSDVAGPYLVMVGIDHFFPADRSEWPSLRATQGFGSAVWLTRHLARRSGPRNNAARRYFSGSADRLHICSNLSRPT